MLSFNKIKESVNLSLVRAHLCTLAVVVSFNSSWRVPREAFRYGGLSYGLAYTVAMVTVALPCALLQLAVGQLSQQDAIGIWRAVPFFRGVGCLKFLTTFLSSIYTVIYVTLTATYFFYTLSNPIPFWECTDLVMNPDSYENYFLNGTTCLNETFMAPIAERPEYYLGMALITTVLWIVFPLILYSPAKLMKRLFYVLGPTVIILAIVIVSCVEDKTNILWMQKSSDWLNFLEPDLWNRALIQALWSSQVAGGYLVSASDTVYYNTNVQWTALAFVGANIVASWAGLLFWFSISGSDDNDISSVAVLAQIYNAMKEQDVSSVWPLLIFATLFLSGVITMLTLLYPLYDRFHRIRVRRWRIISAVSSVLGAGTALAVSAHGLAALDLLEEVTVPLLVSLTTLLEMCAFVFIYGWKLLVEDIEFLTGSELKNYWIVGWCAVPGIITPLSLWWIIVLINNDSDWTEPPFEASTLLVTVALAFVTFGIFAAVSVARQVQYDFFAKLKSSFKPSRHWGPRDPITHYYWLARREEIDTGNLPRIRYHRRQLGTLSERPSFLHISDTAKSVSTFGVDIKRRANSDDWIYTVYRRKYLFDTYSDYLEESRKRRSKSMDWDLIPSVNVRSRPNLRNSTLEIRNFTPPSESVISIKNGNIKDKNDIVMPR